MTWRSQIGQMLFEWGVGVLAVWLASQLPGKWRFQNVLKLFPELLPIGLAIWITLIAAGVILELIAPEPE